MIGERLREFRQAQGRSLADVAGRAGISVATLSRIENDKQSLELNLLMALAKVLQVQATEFLAGVGEPDANGSDPLARRISSLQARERAELWRQLAAERRTQRARPRGAKRDVANQIDELLAQVEFLREELAEVRRRVRRG
jgi:transcriptional regulator with XRE-family HTH domain